MISDGAGVQQRISVSGNGQYLPSEKVATQTPRGVLEDDVLARTARVGPSIAVQATTSMRVCFILFQPVHVTQGCFGLRLQPNDSSLLNTQLVPFRPTSVVSEVCQAGPFFLWKKTRPKLAVGRQQVAPQPVRVALRVSSRRRVWRTGAKAAGGNKSNPCSKLRFLRCQREHKARLAQLLSPSSLSLLTFPQQTIC